MSNDFFFFNFDTNDNNNNKDIENECQFCGEFCGKYELCKDCYNKSLTEEIIKSEDGSWIRNVRFGNEYKFYDENKNYRLKENLLNKYEMFFFDIIRKVIKKDCVIIPQVNLQSVVATDTYTRNDELYRNVDFMLFNSRNLIPFLAIEINGRQHYTNDYWKERDKSVKAILNDISIPLLTIKNDTLKNVNVKELKKILKDLIKYLKPKTISRIRNKDKLDLSDFENKIESLSNKKG